MENNEKVTVRRLVEGIKGELNKVIVEQEELIDYSLISLIAGGHVLIEGVPGLAKTLMVKALAKSLAVDFKRVQFTPDLMPADVTGTKIFNMEKREFELKKGPIFTNFLLADEINRTPPKTQAGLLEAMAEETVSIDGEMLRLPSPYMVFATQNPLEYEGTYPLPEALVDRFLMKINISYPSLAAEEAVLNKFNEGFSSLALEEADLRAVGGAEEILQCRKEVQGIKVDPLLMTYMVNIVADTRSSSAIEIGSSPRGSIALLQCSKALAAFEGRDFVTPEDIKRMAIPTLRHRITLRPELELEGVAPEDVLKEILSRIKVPR